MTERKYSKEAAADFRAVKRIFKKMDAAQIEISYDLGRAVNTTLEHAAANREKYDEKVIEQFAADLDCNAAMLYSAGRVFRAWPMKAKFNKLLKLEHDDGWKLKWTHFVHLSNKGVARKRDALAQEAFDGKWTTSMLLKVVTKHNKDSKKDETRGRKNKLVPKSISDCIKHMTTQASRIVDLADTNWFGDKYNVLTELEEEPIDKISDEMIGDMNQAVSDMRSVSSSFICYAEDLQRAADKLVKKKAKQAPSTLHAGETEDEPASKPRRSRRRSGGKTGPSRKSRVGV